MRVPYALREESCSSIKDKAIQIQHHIIRDIVMKQRLINRGPGNKHEHEHCVGGEKKTEHNADFHQIVDYLTGCSINYSLLVDPDLIGPWPSTISWATASRKNKLMRCLIFDAMVAGKRILISPRKKPLGLIYYSMMLSPKVHQGNNLGLNLAISSAIRGSHTKPQSFLPSVLFPSEVFTFMRKNSPKFSGRITPLTSPMLEVITALAAEEAHSTSPHSRAASSPRDAQGTPAQSAAQDSSLQGTADSQGTAEIQGTADSQGTAEIQGTADSQGTAEAQGAADIPQSPNDYTPTDESQTSGGDEGLLDLYALNQDERKNDETEERKSDETEEVIIEEKDTSDVKSGDTEELDLEKIQSTARQSTVTPRTLNFDDETGPSSPIRSTQEEGPKEQFKDDELLADILLNRPRGLSIPGPMQSQPQQPIQATDPKEKGKGILVEEALKSRN
ncbi:hypothetical protein Tco_1547578 [Tanacetum coccineum]